MTLNFKKHFKFSLSIALVWVTVSCVRPPDLPIEPVIKFEKIEFEERVEVIGSTGIEIRTGVLSLLFNVTDGDGDIGFDGGENGSDFSFITNENGSIIQFGDRPEDPSFTCVDYIIESLEGANGIDYNTDGDVADTLRINLNEDRFNFFIDFMVKKDGVFEELDFRRLPISANGETLCGEVPFDSRIPCLSNEDNPCADISQNPGPIEGTIRYEMQSGLFVPIFRLDTIKLVFQMQDRALNKSNVIESPEFTLGSIRP
ncbi:MAG: hypothetical protein ACJAS3_002739 [Roseivirga sp.]|jgi:hypothetical protein